MAACDACKALDKKSWTNEPHSGLTLTGSDKPSRMTRGNVKGDVKHYVCSNCGTTLSRDTDKNDRLSEWWITG